MMDWVPRVGDGSYESIGADERVVEMVESVRGCRGVFVERAVATCPRCFVFVPRYSRVVKPDLYWTE